MILGLPAVEMGRARRIQGFDYRGPFSYFLTVCTFERFPWFSEKASVATVTAQLVRASADYGFEVIEYCFMPDHLHALVEGLRPDSDFRRYMSMFKQRSAFEHLNLGQGRLWQEGYFEHVLRADDDAIAIAAYIFANPVRAGLCDAFGSYEHLGSSRYTVDQLREAVQMRPAWSS